MGRVVWRILAVAFNITGIKERSCCNSQVIAETEDLSEDTDLQRIRVLTIEILINHRICELNFSRTLFKLVGLFHELCDHALLLIK